MTQSRTPAIVGFLIAGAILLGIGYIASRAGGTPASPGAAPRIDIIEPASGDVVNNPVTLRFTTPARLHLSRDGWVANDLHLHAIVDTLEIMPAADDIAQADGAFLWRLPPLEPGRRRVFITWAARHHGNLAGPTDTLTLYIRP